MASIGPAADDAEREIELRVGGDDDHCGDCYTPPSAPAAALRRRPLVEQSTGVNVANSRSARKRIRASERKRVRNRTVRSAVRTKIGRVRHALISGDTKRVGEGLRGAVKALDKAAEKGDRKGVG